MAHPPLSLVIKRFQTETQVQTLVRTDFVRLMAWGLAFIGISFFQSVMAEEAGNSKTDLEFFEQKIRPVLVKECYSCHSAEAAKAGKLRGGLLLDNREGTLKGGTQGRRWCPRKSPKVC